MISRQEAYQCGASRLMNYFAFAKGTEGFSRYEQTIASLVAFAVGKLNGKGEFLLIRFRR